MYALGGGNAARIAGYLKEAQALRRIAAVLTLRQARATVMQSAIDYEQKAAALQELPH